MKEIPLTQGRVALVDDEDYERLAAFRWSITKKRNGAVYAARKMRGNKLVQMHRVVADAPLGVEVDHRNGDGLDNRRANLRLCSKSDNMGNMTSRTNRTGFKGVAFHAASGLWMAQMQRHKKRQATYHHSAEAAAKAYDAMAIKAFGEFARLNFPLTEGATHA